MSPEPATRRSVLRRAWPIVLANSSAPLLGLADTATLGNTGGVVQLGAIALGALVFSFVYWTFGFLRMGTTGFTAQAAGAQEEAEVRATLARALLIGVTIGVGLITLQAPLRLLAFGLLHASPGVEEVATQYFSTRIWGAPATLGTYALLGCFIGLGKGKHLLVTQVCLNALNVSLDIWLAGVQGWGAVGVAAGTAIAEWAAFAVALVFAYRILKQRHADPEPFFPAPRLRNWQSLKRTLSGNADILLRTLLLLLGFGWFTDQSARFGDNILAANHILLEFISFSAFFLDGFAFVAESLVGEAIGARRVDLLERAVRSSTELAAATAVLLAGGIVVWGPLAVSLITDLQAVRNEALQGVGFAALYVLLAFPAFQLDGFFIGATLTAQMRNASLVSLVIFLGVGWPLTAWAQNTGLWVAFLIYVVARAGALGVYYPVLKRKAYSAAAARAE